jgi:hypothetical protein
MPSRPKTTKSGYCFVSGAKLALEAADPDV